MLDDAFTSAAAAIRSGEVDTSELEPALTFFENEYWRALSSIEGDNEEAVTKAVRDFIAALMLVASESDDAPNPVEDGFTLVMNDTETMAVVRRLINGGPVTIRLVGGGETDGGQEVQ